MAAVVASAQPRRLRVGLFADTRLQPRWIAEAFARVAASPFAEIAAIAILGAEPPRPGLAARAYERLDGWAFGQKPDPPVDLPGRVPHAVLLEGASRLVPGLDVAFALGAFDDSLLDGVARYGVWRFELDGRREVAEGAPLTGSGVKVRLRPGAPPRLAYRSWSRTDRLSAARNRAPLLCKAAEFPWRALRELHRFGPAWLERCPVENRGQSPISDTHAIARGNRALTPILGRIARRALEKALHVEQWQLAFRFGAGALDPQLSGFTRIVPPRDRTWADPFALERNGRYFVFFEELPFAAGKGHISMIEIDGAGRWSAPVRVLERDYHLSYPFLLEHEGRLYMIPESAQNRTVEAWRCVEFPLRWRLERVLLEGVRCVDATLHRAGGRWWMFANAAAGESRSFDDELHLFHAARPFGEWQAHRANPVRSDARCARPAGALYERGGALYRPAQVCVPRYGAGLSIQRVLRLTPEEYAERQVERVLPGAHAGILGIHTVNRAGYLTVVDAFARRRRI